MIDISERLKSMRKERGYTIQALASGIGISARTYQNYEYGQREISVDALYKLADYYGVTTDYLLGRDADEPNSIDQLAREYNMTAPERSMLTEYLALPVALRGDIMSFLRRAAEKK